MEAQNIHHRPRHLNHTLVKQLEIEREIRDCPDCGSPTASCPDCGYSMAYRGVGRLRSGTLVHYYECVHSHREVHSLSIVISD